MSAEGMLASRCDVAEVAEGMPASMCNIAGKGGVCALQIEHRMALHISRCDVARKGGVRMLHGLSTTNMQDKCMLAKKGRHLLVHKSCKDVQDVRPCPQPIYDVCCTQPVYGVCCAPMHAHEQLKERWE